MHCSLPYLVMSWLEKAVTARHAKYCKKSPHFVLPCLRFMLCRAQVCEMAFTISFVTTLAAAIAIAGMFPSAASFCVQNQWTGPISAYIVPLNGQTYKGVIQPGSSGCCNWNDATCFDINVSVLL